MFELFICFVRIHIYIYCLTGAVTGLLHEYILIEKACAGSRQTETVKWAAFYIHMCVCVCVCVYLFLDV